jgi:hypothetical protein
MTNFVAMTQTASALRKPGIRLCRAIGGLLILSLCASANAQDDLPVLDLNKPVRLNFAGSWEKDFQRSDKWEDELSRVMRVRQEQATLQRSGISTRSAPSVSLSGIKLNSSRRGPNIVNLARLAEYISRQTTMKIIQDRNEVRIERRGEAPLICGMATGPTETFSSPHGSEFCGWDRNQLVFEVTLPEDLFITHQFAVSSDGSLLRLITSIQSGGDIPFTLNQAFNRYEAPPDQYNCIQTISRGRMCSQRTPLD